MKCTKVETRLERYFDGELRESTARRIEKHLDSCPACNKQFQELAQLQSLLQKTIFGAVEQAPYAELSQRVMANLEGPKPAFKERFAISIQEWFAYLKPVWVASAVMLLIGLLAIPLFWKSGSSSDMSKISNECIIEDMDVGNASVVINEASDKMKVIWVIEEDDSKKSKRIEPF